jgi:hypothetical protein
MADYNLWLTNNLGVRQMPLDGYLSFECQMVTNNVGTLTVSLPDSYRHFLFPPDCRIEIWRSLEGAKETLLFDTIWLVRKRTRRSPKTVPRSLNIMARSLNNLLRRRFVAYAAGSAQAQKTGALDNVMKAIVRENLGSSAGTGRDWSSLLSVELDRGAAPSATKAFSKRIVFDVLQELAQSSEQAGTPLYFDIVAVNTYPHQFEFRTFINQRGNDHRVGSSSALVIGPDDATLIDVELSEDWDDEVTYVEAAGQDVGASRLTQTVEDTARIGASPFGRIEAFVDARMYNSAAGLLAEAQTKLRAGQRRVVLTGQVQERPGKRFGVEWGWGDYLTAVVDGDAFDCRVDGVKVRVEGKREQIDVRLRGEI